MSKTVLFYATVKSKKMFSLQGFYRTDIDILRQLGFNVRLSDSVWDFLLFWRYDLSFFYFYRYSFFAGLISRLFGKGTYYTGGIDYLSKENVPATGFAIQRVFFLLCYWVSRKCILVSNTDYENIKKYIPFIKGNKLCIVPHSIDTSYYSYEKGVQREKMFVTIAWMLSVENVKRKGVDRALYLFKEILKIDNTYKMVIVGPTGDGTVYLKSIISTLGIESFVTFTGAIPEEEKLMYLKKGQVYVQLSMYEGFGLAAIEALSSGCLVLHSNTGGLKQGIGNFGIIADVTKEGCREIAERLIAIVSDTDCVSKKREAGFTYVQEHFDNDIRLKAFRKHLEDA